MKPLIKKRSTIYLIWVIPVIAIILSAIMLFNEYSKMGETVTIIFKDARGFKQDETPIKYRGILIGVVKDIAVDPYNLDRFVITARIKKSFAKYLTEGARFWKVSPKLKPTEFTGLSTLFSGTYIEFSPASKDPLKLETLKKQRKFNGYEEEPKTNVTYFKLFSEDGSLIEGAPVLFKNFIVGNIARKSLEGKEVRYIISIDNRFSNLVKVNSHFWKISPLDIKASLPDLKIRVNNALNFFFGGIEFDSPDNSTPVCELTNSSTKRAICNNKGFYLYSSKSEIEYSRKVIKLVLNRAHLVQSPLKLVYYKGEVAGKVINSTYNVEKDTRVFYVRMKTRYQKYLKYRSVFWIERLSFKNPSLFSILRGTHIEFAFYNEKGGKGDTYKLHHLKPFKNALNIILDSRMVHALYPGELIFYGNNVVGEVREVLSVNNAERYRAVIYDRYRYLFKKDAVFYKKKSIKVNLSPEGIDVDVPSLKSILLEGLEFITLDRKPSKHLLFPVFSNRKQAQDYMFETGNGLKTKIITGDIEGIYRGMKIYYKGLPIGKVFQIDYPGKGRFVLKVFIEKRYSSLINTSTVFYRASGIDVHIGIKGIDIKTGPLSSLLRGCILIKSNLKSNSKPLKKYKLFSKKELEEEKYVQGFLSMKKAYGIKENSPVVYLGVVVGKVKCVKIKKDLVKLTVYIAKNYSYLLTDRARFYLKTPVIRVGEVKNLSSIMSPYLEVACERGGKPVRNLKLAGVNPVDSVFKMGLRIYLITDEIKTIEEGAPVMCRGVKIGDIEEIRLSKDGKCVILKAFIEDKFRHLITEHSVFVEVKPAEMKFGFLYAKVNLKSVSSMIKGGVEVIVRDGRTIKSGAKFKLYHNAKEYEKRSN